MKSLSTILIILFTFSSLIAPETLTAKQIADKSFNATKLAGSKTVSIVIIIDSKGRERVRKIDQVTKLYQNGDSEKKPHLKYPNNEGLQNS